MLRALIISLLALLAIAVSSCGGGGGSNGDVAGSVEPVTSNDTAPGDVSMRDLIKLLTRRGVGPGQTGVDVTYAPPAFFELMRIDQPAEMGQQPTLAFFMEEAIHEGNLVGEPPDVFLELEGGERVAPYSSPVTAEDPHHRTMRLFFPRPEGASVDTLRLVMPKSDGSVSVAGTFEWQLPIDFSPAVSQSDEE